MKHNLKKIFSKVMVFYEIHQVFNRFLKRSYQQCDNSVELLSKYISESDRYNKIFP